MEIETLDQFEATPLENDSIGMLLFWLDASVMTAQISFLSLALTAYPLWRALPRVGVSKKWALAAVFPPAAIVLIWIVGIRPLAKQER